MRNHEIDFNQLLTSDSIDNRPPVEYIQSDCRICNSPLVECCWCYWFFHEHELNGPTVFVQISEICLSTNSTCKISVQLPMAIWRCSTDKNSRKALLSSSSFILNLELFYFSICPSFNSLGCIFTMYFLNFCNFDISSLYFYKKVLLFILQNICYFWLSWILDLSYIKFTCKTLNVNIILVAFISSKVKQLAKNTRHWVGRFSWLNKIFNATDCCIDKNC